MYICVYIYTHMHICVYISLSLYIYIYIYMYTHICIYIYMYVNIYIYIYMANGSELMTTSVWRYLSNATCLMRGIIITSNYTCIL